MSSVPYKTVAGTTEACFIQANKGGMAERITSCQTAGGGLHVRTFPI